ncbi:hypothetical protein QBC38DRAFT_362640 [Podospora fimiseda]|uniref:Uncharacterized protein n=1 Tax=Podospora fimiseda TaxID=252190 RepID=A0AAN7BR28_9PEZI|nr:hypothetical protein QBC38DRAFT_362640 [Podospora fimiseda]
MATRAISQAATAAATSAATATKTYPTFREIHGVVISAGLIDKTVRVKVGGQRWNKFIKKHFNAPKTHLVHDPLNSLRLGDVVSITPGFRTSKDKRHVVKHIIAPGSGTPITARPPIPTWEELHAEKEAKRAKKLERRSLRQSVEVAETKYEKIKKEVGNLSKELTRLKRIFEDRRLAREKKKLEEEAMEERAKK